MIAFTLRLEPPPIVFDLYGPDDELIQKAFSAPGAHIAAVIGPPGASGEGPPLLHMQGSASAEWIVNHNKGFHPLITVLGPGGGEVFAQVLHVSVNQARIYFSEPQTGSALVR